ncbi:MAG: hypothetical protein P4L10_04415 [Acidobacteriaceae bacterium]|jgi:DNA-damage-inducible protein D|nr:hypothetical protein [Acidobacteriaceae bacterium]
MTEENTRANKLAEIAFGQAFKPNKTADTRQAGAVSSEVAKTSVDRLLDAFEDASKVDDGGVEFWHARDLQKLLGYAEYRNFLTVVQKAKEACVNSGQAVENHFVDINEMVEIGSGAAREIENIRLTRYASYLIAQTEDKLRREKIRGKDSANQAHHDVGKKVRQTIKDIGGTMPENLPKAENITAVSKRLRKASPQVLPLK